MELYSSGFTLSEIESWTGERRHFYRLLERCLAVHKDGRSFGWSRGEPVALQLLGCDHLTRHHLGAHR